MKSAFFLRAICLVLAIAALSCLVGCSTPAPVQEVTQKRLQIEAQPLVYTQDFCDDVAPRATDLILRALRLFGGPQLTEAEREQALTRVSRDLLSATYRASVTPEELEQILVLVREYCDELEASEQASSHLPVFCRFYQRVVGLVGTARAGMLTFDGIRLYLTNRIVVCEQRYAEYGYAWYLEDANLYRARLESLDNELSDQTLSDAISVFVMLGSFLTGVVPAELSQKSTLLYDGEILQILQMQADKFATLDVTPRQWMLIADIFSDVTPKSANTALLSQLNVLQTSGASARIAQAMPALLSLYRATVKHLTVQDVALLRSDAAQAQKATAICRALAHCEEEFMAFTATLEPLLHTDGTAEVRELKRLGLYADFELFAASTAPIDKDALFAQICTYDSAQPALQDACLSYLFGHAPHLAYAVSTELTKE